MDYIDNVIDDDIRHFHHNTQIVSFTCGCASGVSNCLTGYLFDTIKVRMQTTSSTSMVITFNNLIREEGFMQLFKGMYYPLITVPVVNAVVFASYECYKKVMNKTELSFIDGVESGAFSGLVNSLIASPVELVKCVMQTDQHNTFKNSKDCLKHILSSNGFKGIFKGMFSTIAREVPAYAAQFAAYECIKRVEVWVGIAGGRSGVSCWCFSYPQDIIKTKLQISHNKYKRHSFVPDGGFFQCAKQISNQAGIYGFFRGFTPCLIRAFVANAFGIATYQKAQSLLAVSSSKNSTILVNYIQFYVSEFIIIYLLMKLIIYLLLTIALIIVSSYQKQPLNLPQQLEIIDFLKTLGKIKQTWKLQTIEQNHQNNFIAVNFKDQNKKYNFLIQRVKNQYYITRFQEISMFVTKNSYLKIKTTKGLPQQPRNYHHTQSTLSLQMLFQNQPPKILQHKQNKINQNIYQSNAQPEKLNLDQLNYQFYHKKPNRINHLLENIKKIIKK